MNRKILLEVVTQGNAQVKFYLEPTDEALLKTVRRYKLINCNCPAYARERATVLATIQSAVLENKLTPMPEGTDVHQFSILRISI